MFCTYCGSRFHTATNCPKTGHGQMNRLHMRCTYCGGKDHKYEGCPKINPLHTRPADSYIKD